MMAEMAGVPVDGIAADRERTYGFLASLCLEPPAESVLSTIRDGSILLTLREAGAGEKALAALSELVDAVQAGSAQLQQDLESEHTALFVLASGVVPHESAYLDPARRVGTRITTDVSRFYENAGASILEQCTEMPDHLGLELEFMAFLCRVEQQLDGSSDQAFLDQCVKLQKQFLEQHLSRWAYRCCDEILKTATGGFYKAVAHLIADFLKSDEAYMASRCATQIEGDAT